MHTHTCMRMHVQVHEEVKALRTALMTAQADAHRLEVLAGERAAAKVRRMHVHMRRQVHVHAYVGEWGMAQVQVCHKACAYH